MIVQKEITLSPKPRGYHLITNEIKRAFPELADVRLGIANIFIKHTSAGLSINENADPDVRGDFENYFNKLVPEIRANYKHTAEGLDDMTSHIKTSIFGCSLAVPVKNGEFNLGTWQGIYLCEFRDSGGPRKIVITVMGE